MGTYAIPHFNKAKIETINSILGKNLNATIKSPSEFLLLVPSFKLLVILLKITRAKKRRKFRLEKMIFGLFFTSEKISSHFERKNKTPHTNYILHFKIFSDYCKRSCNMKRVIFFPVQNINPTLFRNKRFALNEMFQRNASKFAIFYA